MKPAATDLGTPRRMFLAVLVLLVLVLAWNLSKPWRTGIREHRVGSDSFFFSAFTGRDIRLETNRVYWWTSGSNGVGMVHNYHKYSIPGMEWASCSRTNLLEVAPQDAHVEFARDQSTGFRIFGSNWMTSLVMVHDGQILLLRNRNDTQTVYALEVVKQTTRSAEFRSRKLDLKPKP